jgi:hypothetical protein
VEDIVWMTRGSIKNYFFAKGGARKNILVLDAHLTFEHPTVHKYALQVHNSAKAKAEKKA